MSQKSVSDEGPLVDQRLGEQKQEQRNDVLGSAAGKSAAVVPTTTSPGDGENDDLEDGFECCE